MPPATAAVGQEIGLEQRQRACCRRESDYPPPLSDIQMDGK